MIKLEIDDIVPVLLHIVDGSETLYPQAEVRNNEGTLLETINLVHSDNGIYIPSVAYTMPDETFIRILYIVYTDSEHLIESTLYSRDLEVFYQHAIDTKVDELHKLQGLKLGSPMSVTPITRTVDGIELVISGNGETNSKVERQ